MVQRFYILYRISFNDNEIRIFYLFYRAKEMILHHQFCTVNGNLLKNLFICKSKLLLADLELCIGSALVKEHAGIRSPSHKHMVIADLPEMFEHRLL